MAIVYFVPLSDALLDDRRPSSPKPFHLPVPFIIPLLCFIKRLNSVGLKNTGCAEITHCRVVQPLLKLLFQTGSL